MIDQATKLRDIIRQKNQIEMMEERKFFFEAKIISKEIIKPKLASRVITITSGKGGVGKTNFTINLGIEMGKQNQRVVIIDADFGLSNIEILLGLMPKYTIADVLNGKKTMEDVLTKGPKGVHFISGGSGLSQLANITANELAYILEAFSFLDKYADVILIDTGAGISKSVINFIKAASETIIVTTPEPTSITDAYSLIKMSKEESIETTNFKVVVNRVENKAEGFEVFSKLSRVSENFLGIHLEMLGHIPFDNLLIKAVKQQVPVVLSYPNSLSSKSIELISNSVLNITGQNNNHDGIKFFMKKLVNMLNG